LSKNRNALYLHPLPKAGRVAQLDRASAF